MSAQKISLQSTNTFSRLFLDYVSGNDKLSSFYSVFPSAENLKTHALKKSFSSEKRKHLHDILREQYAGLTTSQEVYDNIESLLHENTVTVTTGHQLNIFGGPLYFIYKIITTINTAKALNALQKDRHVVPVFWMASEDHDFEEINHFHLFGRKWEWKSEQKGAVGRYRTEGMSELLNELSEKLPLFEKAYLEHKTLSEATRYFVNELFNKDGLIILDADHKTLKADFAEIMKMEVETQFSYKQTSESSERLRQIGYEPQVHAREINLFYLDDQLRERIVRDKDGYRINNTEKKFSRQELMDLIGREPERFSPNVILRPLYQETILPNIVYIGGPAEVAYWLQLKGIFDHTGTGFPALLPRNFALYINKANASRLKKLEVDISEFFLPEVQLKNKFITRITNQEFVLSAEQEKMKEIFSGIKTKAIHIDKTLEASVMADLQRALKIMEDLEKKLKKAEERKNEQQISQLLNLKNKLFPEGGLQERSDNFLNFQSADSDFIQQMKNIFDPFDFSFYVVSENE